MDRPLEDGAPYTEGRKALLKFLMSGEHSAWFKYGPMKVYARRGAHSIRGELMCTFDIANVSIEDESLRGKGTFQSFVMDVEALLLGNPSLLRSSRTQGEIRGIYVENVFEVRLRARLIKMGFDTTTLYGDPVPSYYSPLPMPFGRCAQYGGLLNEQIH